MSLSTRCYFGPGYVPLSPMLFLLSLFVLGPWFLAVARCRPSLLRSYRLFLRMTLLFFVAPAVAVMTMGAYWTATVDFPSRFGFFPWDSADPAARLLRADLYWYIARPVISLLGTIALLQRFRARVAGPSGSIPSDA